MKKRLIKALSIALILSICLTITSCKNGKKECEEIGTTFMESSLNCDFDAMADLCEDDDEFESVMEQYISYVADELSSTEGFIFTYMVKNSTFNIVSSDDSGDGRISVTYSVQVPDPDCDFVVETNMDNPDLYSDLAGFVVYGIEEAPATNEYEVELEFVNRNDQWLITNPDDFERDFYRQALNDSSDYLEGILESAERHMEG